MYIELPFFWFNFRFIFLGLKANYGQTLCKLVRLFL
jgi:hypothetical protein